MIAILIFEIFMTYASFALAVHAVNLVVMWKHEVAFSLSQSHEGCQSKSIFWPECFSDNTAAQPEHTGELVDPARGTRSKSTSDVLRLPPHQQASAHKH